MISRTKRPGGQPRSYHAVSIASTGLALTGASFWFSGTYGYAEGGVAMAIACIAFAAAKDAGLSHAFAGQGRGRIIAGVAGSIGFVISCFAAVGATSHNKQAATDPKAQAISAYETAVKTEKGLEARLAAMGKVLSVSDAETAVTKAVVDPFIFKRTAGCANTAHKAASIAEANATACKPHVLAQQQLSKAREAATLHAEMKQARETIAGGRPAAADAQASTFARILRLDGIDNVQAWISLLLALAIEVTAPLAWAAFAAMSGRTPPLPPAREMTPALQRPALTLVRSGRIRDDEVEAIIMRDVAQGIDRGQDAYAEALGCSIATVSRAIKRITSKDDAKLKGEKVGTRLLLRQVG